MTVRENLALVKAMSARRMIECVGDVLKEQARDADQSPRDVSLGAIHALNDAVAAERRNFTKPQMIHDAVRELVDTLDDPDDGSLISTGLKSLDRFMGGWPRGELSILAGRPSMGKSALVAALARRAAMNGINMMMFSLEMPKKALAARMISDCAYSSREDMRVPYADILRKNLSSFQKQRLAAAIDDFTGYPLKIDDQRGLTMPEIQMRAMRYADELDRKGERLDVIVVDHLGKIRASDRYSGNVTAETGEKSDALMTMSYELDAAVVAAHQLNRNTEGRDDKHPTPADLRNSGDLEQDAHTLIFPYRQSYYLERQKLEDPEKDRIRLATLEKKKNLLEILVSKCRNGACGTVEVFADMPSNHVEDLMR
jgi:replicative DNA helicase